MSELIICDVLCFVSTQYDKIDRDSLYSLIVDFYTLDEVTAAKLLLINECKKNKYY